jgi:hypothetical protein
MRGNKICRIEWSKFQLRYSNSCDTLFASKCFRMIMLIQQKYYGVGSSITVSFICGTCSPNKTCIFR